MLLITVATENEIKPLLEFLAANERVDVLLTGMGPVAAAISLSRYLALHGSGIHGVLNIGVAGAYEKSGLSLLDICLAQQECLGDFGICMEDGIQDFAGELSPPSRPILFNNNLAERFTASLNKHNIPCKTVNFVTVSCCTGTKKRGDFLQEKFSAGCENMEGAAVAMVCDSFNIACAELRCVSNMVQDRDVATWKLAEAVEKLCKATAVLLRDYGKNDSSGG
jgi:futalosine hydrolase